MYRVDRISVFDYTPFGVVVACNVALPSQLTTPTPRHRTFFMSKNVLDERVDDIKDLATDVVLNYGRTVFVAVNVTNSFDGVVTQVASLLVQPTAAILTLPDPVVYQPCAVLFRGASTFVNTEHLLHNLVLSHMWHASLNVPTSYVDVTPNVVTVGCDPAVAAAVKPLLPVVHTQQASTHYLWHRRQLIDEQREVCSDLPEQLPPADGPGYFIPLLNVHPSYGPFLASFLPTVLAEIGIDSVTAVDCAVARDTGVVSARLTLGDRAQVFALRDFTLWMNDELVVMTHRTRTTRLPEICDSASTRQVAFTSAFQGAGFDVLP